MYHSRLNLTNRVVSFALDALTGEPLELSLECNRENILKNNFMAEASPLKVVLADGRALRPPKYLEILSDPSLKPDIECSQGESSAQAAVRCPALIDMADGGRVEIAADWTLALRPDDERMYWNLSLKTAGERIAYFPYLNGIWMGDDWTKDELLMPIHSGDKTVNPTETLSGDPITVSWKWQEYQYDFGLGGPRGIKNKDTGCFERECTYSGPCSMLYMALQNPELNMSIYLTCRDDGLRLKALRASTYGKQKPGVGLAIAHVPNIECGVWTSEECVLMLYEGDWHKAADDYRAWREGVKRPEIARPHRPEWFLKSPGLAAHYDFKYQGGGIVHRFSDIPRIFQMAKDIGLNHLLLSGWNRGGFDNGFPLYTPDPDLGTEQELKDALSYVRGQGGHVAFYINSRLCNVKYEELKALYENGAAMRKDGSLYIEKYGADNLNFACMCSGDEAWQKRLADTVDYLTNTIGADSMYLDQLGMATGVMCYNKNHRHGADLAAWNQGYEEILGRMREHYAQEGVALLFEGASDVHARGASGQLISTMFFNGAFPELYKYTFPDDVLVDMMCPAAHSAMRPATIARKSTFLLYRAFCVGSYLWIYDLEEDNTFRRDPEQLDRLRRVIKVRQAWLDAYGHGRFTDTVALRELPDGLIVKRFELPDGVLITYANEKKTPASVAALWEDGMPAHAFVRSFEEPDCERENTLSRAPSGIRIPIGASEMGYIVLKK